MKKYLFSADVEECLGLLAQHKGSARLVAGATDLMLWIREGRVSPEVLVDVTRIREMRGVAIQGDVLVIGSATTHAEIAADATVKKLFPSLASGCLSVGSPQIRNIATLAGNIVSAQPAADSVVPMTALGASCEILSEDGRTVKPLSALSKAVGESHVDPTKEILTKIYIDIPKCRYGTSFKRIAPREAMALPVVNVAVMLKAEGAQIAEARIVVSPVAVVPFRAKETEAFLHGKVPSEELLKQAAEIVGNEVSPRDSLQRGSGAYRKMLVKDLVAQALKEASAACG